MPRARGSGRVMWGGVVSALLRSGDAAVLARVSTGGRTAGLSYFCPTDPTCRLAPAPRPSAGAGAWCCSALAAKSRTGLLRCLCWSCPVLQPPWWDGLVPLPLLCELTWRLTTLLEISCSSRLRWWAGG